MPIGNEQEELVEEEVEQDLGAVLQKMLVTLNAYRAYHDADRRAKKLVSFYSHNPSYAQQAMKALSERETAHERIEIFNHQARSLRAEEKRKEQVCLRKNRKLRMFTKPA